MSSSQLADYRRRLLAGVHGEILEIGVGSGLNLAHYPDTVKQITTVDPSPGMNKLLRRRIEQSGITVRHRMVGAESMPFPDDSFDCVVSTWTMCSIPHVAQAMRESYRVLRPGGHFVFLEHGLSDEPAIQIWQHRLNGLQRFVAGCRLDLNYRELFAREPFASVQISNFCIEQMPRTHGTMYQGVATK